MDFNIESTLNDVANTAKQSGLNLLAAEIEQHGKKKPSSRPDPSDTPATVSAPTPGTDGGMMTKKNLIIAGGVGVGLLVLALILKKK